MANPNKQKGTKAETAVVRYLKEHGVQSERRALSGNKDQGDIKAIINKKEITIEVKTGKQTSNPSRSDITEWLRQTKAEGINSQCPAVLIIVRYRRKLIDADVYILYDDKVIFCYLDQLIDCFSKL